MMQFPSISSSALKIWVWLTWSKYSHVPVNQSQTEAKSLRAPQHADNTAPAQSDGVPVLRVVVIWRNTVQTQGAQL